MLENLRKMFAQQNLQQQQQQNKQQTVNGVGINATPTPSTSGDETAALAAALSSVKAGNRKAIQQNLNALLGNKFAGKLLNNLALQQMSKQSSIEQPTAGQQSMSGILTQQQTTSTTSSSLSKQASAQQPGTGSPTIKALQEYETHLRNMLARGNSTELENFSLNTLEALVSQSLENVVSLMREVQSELNAIELEEQQYRAEQAESNQVKASQQSQADLLRDQDKNGKHYWARSYTLPSRHSLSAPLNASKPQSVTGISPSARLGSAASNLASTNAGSLGFGLNNLSGLLSGNDLYREMKKRSSTPFLDAISMDNLAYLTGNWNANQASFESNDSRANLTWSEVSEFFEMPFY